MGEAVTTVVKVAISTEGDFHYATSDDVFGLDLASRDRDALLRDVPRAIELLYRENHGVRVGAKPVSEPGRSRSGCCAMTPSSSRPRATAGATVEFAIEVVAAAHGARFARSVAGCGEGGSTPSPSASGSLMNAGKAICAILLAVVLGTGATVEAKEGVSAEERQLVCRAAIATVMGRPLAIIKAKEGRNNLITTSYRRQSDGTVWRNLCRLEGSRVVWASIREDGTPGRWRNQTLDSVITFQISAAGVTIEETYSDGSSRSETYSRNFAGGDSGDDGFLPENAL